VTPDKQKLLIEYILSSPDLFTITNNIVNPKYFDPEFRNTIKFVKQYYNQYRALPDSDQLYGEVGIDYKTHELTKDKTEYCVYEVESYCKRKAIEFAILSSPDLMEKEDYGTIEKNIRDAISTSIHRSVGISFFDDPEERLAEAMSHAPLSTGYDALDECLDGGFMRQEMQLFSANSGGGKSLFMANLGLNYAEIHKLNVLFISLELPISMIYKRYVSMLTGYPKSEIETNIQEISIKIRNAKKSHGDIVIEKMPTNTTTNEIRAFLKEYEVKRNSTPDVLIVDYLDCMGSNEKISADNVFQKDKAVSEELTQLAKDMNLILITASQQNRSGVDAKELNHTIIAGGASKINTTDNYASVVLRGADMFINILKTRSSDGVGKVVQLFLNRRSLRVTNPSTNDIASNLSKPTLSNNEIKAAQSDQRSRLMAQFGDF
jgi:KaiC/GvpD/RAD55 family RecA-like ATPase